MNRIVLLSLMSIAAAWAQPIPGRYIVEFDSAPAIAESAARGERFAANEARVIQRRAEIRAQHDSMERSIRALGGVVHNRYDTLINGMAVELSEEGAARLRQMPGVRGVYPDEVQHKYLDHAVNVHKVVDAWKAITGGQAGAGAGIKVGLIDS